MTSQRKGMLKVGAVTIGLLTPLLLASPAEAGSRRGGGVVPGPTWTPPPVAVVAPPHRPTFVINSVEQVWVPATYRTVIQRVWVPESCQTVLEQVWIPPVTQCVQEQVWVSDGPSVRGGIVIGGEDFRVVLGGRTASRGHYETRSRHVIITPGRYESVPRQVLIPAHWEEQPRQELVTPGHYEWRSVRVEPMRRWDSRGPDPRHDPFDRHNPPAPRH